MELELVKVSLQRTHLADYKGNSALRHMVPIMLVLLLICPQSQWWCLIAKPNHVIITLGEVQVLSRSLYVLHEVCQAQNFCCASFKTSLSNISKAMNKARAMACRKVSVSLLQ